MKDGESEAKISSVSGANRKRKWKEEEEEDEEEEQKAEDSSDLDTSSDDGDDVQEEEKEEEKEAKQLLEPVCSSQEEKAEEKTEKDGQNEERNTDQGQMQTGQHQKPSQPVVFVPVNRSPEIQVCADVKVTQPNSVSWPFTQSLVLWCRWWCRRLG